MPVEAKPLFRSDVLRPLIAELEWNENQFQTKRAIIDRWAGFFDTRRGDQFNEKEILPDFLTDIFCGVLGYERPADNSSRYTFSREKHVQVDGKYADAVLGVLTPSHQKYYVALEGKGPSDPLDRPYAGRKMSAVDQGYRYAINLPADWIIVTSMRQTRLYHKGSDQYTFELFDIDKLARDEATLKRFIFLFSADRVCPLNAPCHFDSLLTASSQVGKELTREYYLEYAGMRRRAFEQLRNENKNFTDHAILSATQKLLDRVLFIAFCEDRGLLPSDTIKHAFEHRDPYNPKSIWENFKGLFRSIDVGNSGLNIPAYNGGLFAYDEVLDTLIVTDEVCEFFRNLASYDYRPAAAAIDTHDDTGSKLIDVDILGHIFEQSITDLEQIRNELDGRVPPKTQIGDKSRRKKEGAFYTPSFITRYIVEQSLGPVLQDRFETLRQTFFNSSKGTARSVLEAPAVYDRNSLNSPQRKILISFWEAWQDELKTVRILDPACGSGAFLIEAFEQLHTLYQSSNERLEELRGSRTFFDPDRQILQSNLYGVDLNEEAIEICRLSLWIKTAARGKALTSLDHTIRVGNSVVNDESVHPLAFDWNAAFPEVFEQGGFDVIIGNPPYIRQEWISQYKQHWKTQFTSYDSAADIFTYFFELGIRILRDGARLGFITSGSWIKGSFGAPLRGFITHNTSLESMVDFGEYQPFKDAEMIRPTITVLRKGPPGGSMKLFKFLTSGEPPTNLSDVIAVSPVMDTSLLSESAWELDTNEVAALRWKLAKNGTKLREVVGPLYNGIKTGCDEAYVIDSLTATQLMQEDERSSEVLIPVVQGTHMRTWHVAPSGLSLIALKSSVNYAWPWSGKPDAEAIFSKTYPAIYRHLQSYQHRLAGRSDQGEHWWELRSCSYWELFTSQTIVWPDIANNPRFAFLDAGTTIGMTGFVMRCNDPFVLAVLSSWATWFFISKTAQPLRLRSDRWQYRLKSQYMEHVPIPEASEAERALLSELAVECSALAKERFSLVTHVRNRLTQSFASSEQQLNEKAKQWWSMGLQDLGNELKKSFKLKSNPMQNPNTADVWADYIASKTAMLGTLEKKLALADDQINSTVERLFKLTKTEIQLLHKEVSH